MKLTVLLSFIFLTGVSVQAEEMPESGQGRLKLQYHPIVCIKAPCPQFRVLSIDGKPVANLGADLTNLDPKKSAISAFRKIWVKGNWTKKQENYLEVEVEEWQALITQKVPLKE